MAQPSSIRDVSKKAGVSIATVSRAFSDPDKLKEKTLKKVREAAEELNYRPNYLSQVFRTNRSKTVLVMVPDLSNPFFTRVLSGIEAEAANAGYSILLTDTKDDLSKESAGVDLLDSSRVDGIIQLGKTPIEAVYKTRDSSNVPFVHGIEGTEDTGAPTVMLDNVGASRSITEHLIALGHKAIGVVGGPSGSQITKFRLEGIKQALNKSGLELDEDAMLMSPFRMEDGMRSANRLLSNRPDLTALVCMSDDLAIGAIKALKESGLSVPEDVSVVGFDNVPYSAFCDPALTTVTQPSEQLGATTMKLLLQQMRQEELSQRRVTFRAEIVVRESCSAPRT